MSKRGLPSQVVMRHDQHFVEDLTQRDTTAVGRMIPLSAVQPDPDQPRSGPGDLSELVLSIRDKGVLEPILVRPEHGESGREQWRIISGERRYRASLEAGLFEIPAIEMEVSDQEALEIALVENLQREDLTAFEEAQGYEALANQHDYTHEQISQAVGKSRTVVTESLGLLKMPKTIREQIAALGIDSKSILLEVLKLPNSEAMSQLLEKIASLGLGRDAVRKEVRRMVAAKKAGRGNARRRKKPYSFEFRPSDKSYRLSLSFRQSTVEPEDLIRALESALEELRTQQSGRADKLFE